MSVPLRMEYRSKISRVCHGRAMEISGVSAEGLLQWQLEQSGEIHSQNFVLCHHSVALFKGRFRAGSIKHHDADAVGDLECCC